MRSDLFPGATMAPPVSAEFLQRSRISARIGVSPAVADVVASLAFGTSRRGDLGALASLTAERVGASTTGRC
jgi:hypothetical protein